MYSPTLSTSSKTGQVKKSNNMVMVPEHDLFNELEAARKELRLLRTENEELKKKVADFESNIGDTGRVHHCEVENEEIDGLQGSEFRRLPDEILLKIVDLSAPNRVFLVNVMRRVCRKFERIVKDPSLWKGDIAMEFYADEEEQHLETAHAHCLNVIFDRLLHEKTVGLHVGDARRAMYGDGALNRVEISGEHLHKLTLRCPELKRLSLSGLRVRAWGRPINDWGNLRAPEFKSLEVLRLHCCDTSPDTFKALIRRGGSGFHESVPDLRDFYMTGARDSCMATVLPDMSGCERLERFELEGGCFNFVHDLRERVPLPRGIRKLRIDAISYHFEYMNREVVEGALGAHMAPNCEIEVVE